MSTARVYAIVILISCCQAAAGQQKVSAALERKYIIPFQLTAHNNISIPVILNKKDTLHLMFHTAANSINLTEEATKKITTLNFDRIDSVKSWGGSGNESRYSKGNSLQIGELYWYNELIWEDKNSGPGTDGKFGTDLFNNMVIAIDFDKNIITLSTRLPADVSKYEKLKLAFENDGMFMESVCKIGNATYKNRFLLHSGYAGAVLLDDKFTSESKIGEQLKIVDEKELKDSYGHVIKTKKAILPAFIIGNSTLSNVPVGFFEGAIGRQKMSIIGGDILKRFNIIIDAQRSYIYLKPNKLSKTNYTNV
jgi:hypothetical protein